MKISLEGRPVCCTPGMREARSGPETLLPDTPWTEGQVKTSRGPVPRVSTNLTFSDRLGSWKARWGIGRMRYMVRPGLYAAGEPAGDSPVLVTANYKLSFDRLRFGLGGLDAWVLVLDTKGINVWCAAGKGTFGTEEVVRRVEEAGLAEIVAHRRLIVPQLGAPGVSAREVKKKCGFKVFFGPVRASDLKEFMASGIKATPDMRRVKFNLKDRVPLIPMEMLPAAKYALATATAFLLLSGLGPGGYSVDRLMTSGALSAALAGATLLVSAVLGPVLLPWLPGRAFSLKGFWAGLLIALSGQAFFSESLFGNWASAASWWLLLPAGASFVVMNFTGSSTFTSLSGVRKEMRIALPFQITGALAGLALWVGGHYY